MNYYWHLELWDKEIIKVKPNQEKIDYIQQLIAKGEGAVVTPTRTIPIKNIKDFRLSDEPFIDQKLLEDSSQAFNTPMFNDDGSIQSRYVKKSVPQRMWDRFYKYNSAYKLLSSGGTFVMIAFVLPVHQIDHEKVEELTDDEEQRLLKRVY